MWPDEIDHEFVMPTMTEKEKIPAEWN